LSRWDDIYKLAERSGHSRDMVDRKLAMGHTVAFETDDFLMLIDRAVDDALVIWLCVGAHVREWFGRAEAIVIAFAKQIGCDKLRIEGRKGWLRVLPHWQHVRTDGDCVVLELSA